MDEIEDLARSIALDHLGEGIEYHHVAYEAPDWERDDLEMVHERVNDILSKLYRLLEKGLP